MKHRTKSLYYKNLSKKMSDRAKRGWKIRRLRMEANPREPSFEEIIEKEKFDRKGKYYATWEKENLKIELYYSLDGRSDQFDIIVTKPSRWNDNLTTQKYNKLSLPKILKIFQN